MELDNLDRRELLKTARHRVLVENPAVLYGF